MLTKHVEIGYISALFIRSSNIRPFHKLGKRKFQGSTLVRGFQCSPTVDLNTYFFVSIIRNQELGYLLRGGVAGCITGLLLRDAEFFKGLPDPWMIVDGEDKFTLSKS